MENKRFLNVNDVADYLDISVPTAYKIIRRLNDELSKMGYLTVSGRVSKTYFEQKVYGGVTATVPSGAVPSGVSTCCISDPRPRFS